MRYHEIINEMPMPTPEMREQRYYHGTSKTSAAESILVNGLKGAEVQGRGQLAPVKGRVYMTPSIEYATIYALGGVMMGHEYFGRDLDAEPYGYVFVISGDVLGDVQPDEDSIGEFVSKHTEWTKDSRGVRTGFGFKHDREDPENSQKAAVWYALEKAMTPKQFRDAAEGYTAQQAAGGKRALKKLTDAQKMLLLKWGAHLAADGIIKPSECWRIEKKRCIELAKDASNFFEIAERIA
jgi:hypothetical protein